MGRHASIPTTPWDNSEAHPVRTKPAQNWGILLLNESSVGDPPPCYLSCTVLQMQSEHKVRSVGKHTAYSKPLKVS